MIALLVSTLAVLFLPTGCNFPGWSFCVNVPPDAVMEVAENNSGIVTYSFLMTDGSRAEVRIGEDMAPARGGLWSERRQGLETVRWRADGAGRIDYYIERVWADTAGIPRFLHARVDGSETGEIAGAEALIQTLRSCDPQMCPDPGPVNAPVPELPPEPPITSMAGDDGQ